ncbi:TerD family protein [Nocardia alba]|uniref:Stress response protein SCP2 n=1 Tax=Nocardia alba TaxID=225051 RepID=A0A4R1FZH4_9NOCA|nr:TerD family protein [Nocardia alba]TCK00678.1 stress response protein SCP2 [Nocardia alba]
MIHLKAGQNTALTADSVRFTAQTTGAVELGALVVGEDLRVRDAPDHVCASRPSAPGVSFAGAAVDLTLSQIRSDAHAVLLFVTGGHALGTVTASLYENGSPAAEFVIAPTAGESALICLEVYRRGGGWKLRALGQGYAGGSAQLLTAHGVTPPPPAQAWQPAPLAPPSAPTETVARPVPTSGIPLEVDHGLQRMWMIFEDAARSAAALVSARDYAAKRLDQELSEAVSDPATRNTPAADAARAQAQRRHDELVALADADHRRDSNQLGLEIAEADAAMPAALASWLAPAWTSRAVRSDGIRLGELYALDRGGLRVPYCVPVPLNRPLWVDTESTAAASRVIGALVARLVAAIPDKSIKVDLIDLTGGLRTLAAPLAPLLAGPVIADHGDISARLAELANAAELADIAYNSGQAVPPTEHRILVAADFPHGYQGTDIVRLGQLMIRGDLIGLSLVIVGSNGQFGDGPVDLLAQSCRHLPTLPGTPLFDPWTGNAWELDLDMLPAEPELQARYLRM